MTHVDKAEAWDVIVEKNRELISLHGQLQDCGRRYLHLQAENDATEQLLANSQQDVKEAEIDRDEWKRRALEAEEAGIWFFL